MKSLPDSCRSISSACIFRDVGISYECAPSDRARKGRRDQSLSFAGSVPSSTPIHVSTSGPLSLHQQHVFISNSWSHRAWWNATTHTMGLKGSLELIIAMARKSFKVAYSIPKVIGQDNYKARVLPAEPPTRSMRYHAIAAKATLDTVTMCC